MKKIYEINVGYLLVAPALIFTVIFVFYPLVQMVFLSFFRWTFVSPTMTFVWLENYKRMLFKDPVYFRSLINAILLGAQSSAIQIPIGIALATVITKHGKIGGILWTIVFLPYVISSVAVSLVWTWIYNPQFGALNVFLESIGLRFLVRHWLSDINTALIAIFGTVNWIYIGWATTMSIAALRSIPQSIFESAMVDGLSGFQIFRRITLPLLKELLIVLVIIDLSGAFTFFDLIWVMTQGGPSHATQVPTTWLYRAAFRSSEPGYGSAIGVTIFIFSFGIAQLLLKATRARIAR